MGKHLSEHQAIKILVMFTIGTPIISGIAKSAKADAWVSIIIGAVLSLPFYLIFAALLKAYKNKNIYEISEVVLGKFLGKLVGAILIFNGFYLTAVLIRKVAEFMAISGLTDTPLMMLVLLIVVVSINMLKKGIGIFGKWCQMYFWIVLIVLFVEIIFLYKDRNFDNLYPVFYHGVKPAMDGAINVMGFPMVQCAHLLGFFNLLEEKGSYRKVFLFGWLISTIILLILTIDNITVIGPEIFEQAYFPSYITFRMMSIGEFLQKIESLMVLSYLIYGLVKLTCTLFTTIIGFKMVFNLQTTRSLIVPICFLNSILAYLTYEDMIEVEYVFLEIYIPYSIVINGLLPILIYVVHLMRRNSLNT